MSTSWDKKPPVDQVDYEGLQLDTRAKDSTEKHIDPLKAPQGLRNPDDSDNEDDYLSEKQAAVDTPAASPNPTTSTTAVLRGNPIQVLPGDSAGSNPEFKLRRTCGMRRQHFWIVFGTFFAIIIAAAVIGGAVGGTRHSSSSTWINNGPLKFSDVIVGSPLSVISYGQNGNNGYKNQQTLRMYYQSAIGNIKEVVSDESSSWQNATPIFTDAVNNTGLAAITYLNGSDQQGSIFYVGRNKELKEKRKNKREPGISSSNSDDDPANDDLANGWHSYRIAAVYSQNFHSGPGCRLYYHTGNFSSGVQEMIWYQKNDSWANGTTFNAVPNSHLSATIDESTQLLRLFYSTGDSALQESWVNISKPNAQYEQGFNIPKFLDNSSDIATVSDNGTTYLYHYAHLEHPPAIHELIITGQPGSADNQETHNETNLPVSPNLTSRYGSSPYQPLAAAKSGPGTQLHVFWADGMTGSSSFSATASDARSGYAQLWEVSRSAANDTWSAKSPSAIPLGQIDTFN